MSLSLSPSNVLTPKVRTGPITKDLTIVRAGSRKALSLSSGIVAIGIVMDHAITREKIRTCGHVITCIQQMTVPDSIYFAGGTEHGGVQVFSLGFEKNELEILLDFAKGREMGNYIYCEIRTVGTTNSSSR